MMYPIHLLGKKGIDKLDIIDIIDRYNLKN